MSHFAVQTSAAVRNGCGPDVFDPARLVAPMGAIFSAASVADVWTATVHCLGEAFPECSVAAMEFVESDRAVVRASSRLGEFTRSEVPVPISPDSQAAFVIASPEVVTSHDLRDEIRFVPSSFLTLRGARSSISAPCTTPSGRPGIVGVQSHHVGAFDGSDAALLGAVGGLLTQALSVVARRTELEVASSVDPLTKVMSRGAIFDVLARRLDEGRRTQVALIDLDGFAVVNERHGHLVGDRVLERLARRLEQSTDLEDSVGRLGSDEFLIVGDAHDVAETTHRAQRLVGHVEQMVLVGSASTQVSASIGVATSRPGDDIGSMLARADHLMHGAKASGRGQVAVDRTVPDIVADATSTLSGSTQPTPSPARPAAPTATPITVDVVDEAIAGVGVVFQKIVHAHDGSTFGVEALTRGPAGHPLEYPDRLFASATTFGRLGELELAAKRAAFCELLPDDVPLFVNLEPSLLCDPTWLGRLAEVWTDSGTRRPIVAEITERAVLLSPGSLLDAVDAVRSLGWDVALDDVGARSESLAALRLVRPDIVKLDMGLIRGDNRAHAAHVGAAVAGYREEHPCSIVAEGIETARDRALADVLGADLLQGYLFGRPASLDAQPISVDPTASVSSSERWRVGRKADLLHVSRHVESLVNTPDAVLLATVQHADHFTARTRRQYSTLSRRAGFVGVLGESIGVHAAATPGVRLVDLDHDDATCLEWNVVILSPTKSIALLATEVDPHGDDVDQDDRRFRYRLVSDLAEVEQAARRLMRYF